MAQPKIQGKLVGLPTCSDPKTSGLTFSIGDGSKIWRFRVAGKLVPKQAPRSALAMAALLGSAFVRGDKVMVAYNDDQSLIAGRRVAVTIGVPAGPFGPFPAENPPLPNPLTGTIWSAGVSDYNQGDDGALIQTNITYPGSDQSAYLASTDKDEIVHFASHLATARVLKSRVEIEYKKPNVILSVRLIV